MRSIILVLVLGVAGCAGSLETARPARVGASPEQSARCSALSDRREVESGLAKFFAVASGGQGIATIPIADRDAEIGLAIGAASSVALAAGFQVMADFSGEAWARECAR